MKHNKTAKRLLATALAATLLFAQLPAAQATDAALDGQTGAETTEMPPGENPNAEPEALSGEETVVALPDAEGNPNAENLAEEAPADQADQQQTGEPDPDAAQASTAAPKTEEASAGDGEESSTTGDTTTTAPTGDGKSVDTTPSASAAVPGEKADEKAKPEDPTAPSSELSGAQNAATAETAQAAPTLLQQTVSAAVYADESRAHPAENGTAVVLTGLLPQGAKAEAWPVEGVTVNGCQALAAYDITVHEANGEIYEPTDPQNEAQRISVSITAPELQRLAADAAVYHVKTDAAGKPWTESEKVEQTQVTQDGVQFDVGHFSIYAIVGEVDDYQPARNYSLQLKVGETLTLWSNSTNTTGTWSVETGEECVRLSPATVQNNRSTITVTGLAAGEARIVYSPKNEWKKQESFSLTVVKQYRTDRLYHLDVRVPGTLSLTTYRDGVATGTRQIAATVSNVSVWYYASETAQPRQIVFNSEASSDNGYQEYVGKNRRDDFLYGGYVLLNCTLTYPDPATEKTVAKSVKSLKQILTYPENECFYKDATDSNRGYDLTVKAEQLAYEINKDNLTITKKWVGDGTKPNSIELAVGCYTEDGSEIVANEHTVTLTENNAVAGDENTWQYILSGLEDGAYSENNAWVAYTWRVKGEPKFDGKAPDEEGTWKTEKGSWKPTVETQLNTVTNTFTATRTPILLTVEKDDRDSHPLAGATFQLLYKSGNEWVPAEGIGVTEQGNFISQKSGRAQLHQLTQGRYCLKEIDPPEGYGVEPDLYFELKANSIVLQNEDGSDRTAPNPEFATAQWLGPVATAGVRAEAEGEAAATQENGVLIVVQDDTETYELPDTGGAGVAASSLPLGAGLLGVPGLVVCSLVCAQNRMRRRHGQPRERAGKAAKRGEG